MKSAASPVIGNVDDQDYHAFLDRVNARFASNATGPLFTTDASGLWDAYLSSFGDADRQHHNCHACRHYIERWAGLVTIDERGITTPAVWNVDDAPEEYKKAIGAMAKIVRKAKVTGVFLSSNKELGTPVTGQWRHLSVTMPKVFARTTQTAGQAMAEKREDYINVKRALAEFTMPMVEQAMTLLKTDSLARAEKVIGPAQFLYDLHAAKATALNYNNVVWLGIATAPAGFCHPRSSMVGTLLEDIAAGMDFAEVSRRWKSKMHPLQYQRPQSAPNAGAIAQAEKIVAEMGAAGSLARRFARVEDVTPIWLPKATATESKPQAGVFSHLKSKNATPAPDMKIPPLTMTWAKFSQQVLPTADRIQFHARASRDAFMVLVTAVDPDAPPILQWDTLEHRNPVSWYFWHGGSSPEQFGLTTGAMCDVSAVTMKPSMWHGSFPQHGEGVIFLLKDARETRQSGAALFPECMKSEFHGIRSVIESYSRGSEISGMEDGSACGIGLQKGGTWAHVFRVTSGGKSLDYLLDRWD